MARTVSKGVSRAAAVRRGIRSTNGGSFPLEESEELEEVRSGSVKAQEEREAAAADAWLQLPFLHRFVDEDTLVSQLPSPPQGETLTDPAFPPVFSSILRFGQDAPAEMEVDGEIEWCRVAGSVFKFGPRTGDIMVGPLHNEWFFGALALVATRPPLLLDLILSNDQAHLGIYTLQFFKHGAWQHVVIDDWFPCRAGKGAFLFGACQQEGLLWASLIEKAYAKLHGSYAALCGGNVVEALVDLTGGSAYALSLVRDYQVRENAVSGRLWLDLLSEHTQSSLIGCSRSCRHEMPVEEANADSIATQRTYCLLDMRETSNGQKLMKMKDVWGEVEWRGPWSDSSEEWMKPENQGILEELQHSFTNDGTFWIAYEDFVSIFSKIYVCRLFPENAWHRNVAKGAWIGSSAGGSPSGEESGWGTWCNNPQFVLRVSRSCRVQISLMQRDTRAVEGQRLPKADRRLPISLIVLKTSSKKAGRKWGFTGTEDVVANVGPFEKQELSVQLFLDAALAYVIVPHTVVPGQEGAFVIRTFSEAAATLHKVPPSREVSIEGSWTEDSAGGSRKHPTWASNPQYLLSFPSRARLLIVLQQLDAPASQELSTQPPNEEGDDDDWARQSKGNVGIGISLLRQHPEHTSDRCSLTSPANLTVGESDYVSSTEATLYADLPVESNYIICPSMAEAGVRGDYRLTVYSSLEARLSQTRNVRCVQLHSEWAPQRSGGCDLHDSWTKNPRFLLSLSRTGWFRIGVKMTSEMWRRGVPLESMIGFYVMRSLRSDGRITAEKKAVVAETPFVPMSEVSMEVELQATPNPNYVIMPCTYAPARHGMFILSVSSNHAHFTLTAVDT